MRFLTTLLIGTAFALPAMAQTAPAAPATAPTTTSAPAMPAHHHAMKHAAMHKPMPHHMARTGHPGAPTADDQGPFTPEANRAYDGGGAILTGQPGGPPPPASDVLTQPRNQPIR